MTNLAVCVIAFQRTRHLDGHGLALVHALINVGEPTTQLIA
jgi:hypothetical protein